VQVSINLQNGATTLNRTWTAFQRGTNTPTYQLRYPLNLYLATQAPYLGTNSFSLWSIIRLITIGLVGVTLSYVDTLYNAYEGFEEDEECHVSKVSSSSISILPPLIPTSALVWRVLRQKHTTPTAPRSLRVVCSLLYGVCESREWPALSPIRLQPSLHNIYHPADGLLGDGECQHHA
jgi:hypothetical protein